MERQLKSFGNAENRYSTMSEADVKFVERLISDWLAENGIKCGLSCGIEDSDTWYMRVDIDSDAVFYDRIEQLIHDWVYKHENGDPPMYLPLNRDKKTWTWKFYHPECPDQFLALTDKIESGEVKNVDLHAVAEDMDAERKFITPVPKEGGNCAFLVLKKKYYDLILRGQKTAEYREYNEYYVNKFLSHKVKYVKMNLGYKSNVSMTYEIAEMNYTDGDLETEISCYKDNGELKTEKDLEGFVPSYFKIVLGKRVR